MATLQVIKLELLAGAGSEREYRDLADALAALHELDLSAEVWEEAGAMAFRLRRRGVTIPHVDALIAAAAIIHGCRLLHDDKHFKLIGANEPLRQEQLKGTGAR